MTTTGDLPGDGAGELAGDLAALAVRMGNQARDLLRRSTDPHSRDAAQAWLEYAEIVETLAITLSEAGGDLVIPRLAWHLERRTDLE